jgi:hypothetical protein
MSAGMTWNRRPGRWLVFTGISEFVIAFGLVAVGLSIPEAATSMYITAGILALTGVGLLLWGRAALRTYEHAQHLRTVGVPARASIVSMRQTGVTMNDQPQIELELSYEVPGRGTHTTSRKEYVPMMLLGVLTNGVPLPIKVNPDDPSDIAIEWELAGVAGGAVQPPVVHEAAAPQGGGTVTLGAGAGPGGLPDAAQIEQARARLRASGVDGTATITGAQLTALEIAGNAVVQVQMTVRLPGRDPYAVAHMALIPEPHAGSLVVGATVPVKVDRDDPNSVMVDWDRA